MKLFYVITSVLPLFCTAQDKRVQVKAHSNDISLLQRLYVATTPAFPTEFLPDIIGEAGEVKDSTTTFGFALDRPQIAEIRTLGKNVRCFIAPNSTISFTLKKTGPKLSDVEFIFTGANRASNEVIMNADRQFGTSSRPKIGTDPEEYISSVTDLFDKRVIFVNNVAELNSVARAAAIGDAKSLKEYLLTLPLKIAKSEIEYRNNSGFKKAIASIDTVDESLLHYSFHRIALLNKYCYQYSQNPFLHFSDLIASVQKNLRGKIREYVLAGIIGIFSEKQQNDYRMDFLSLAPGIVNTITDTAVAKYAKIQILNYTVLNHAFPEDILTRTRIQKYGTDSVTTIGALFNRQNEKAIYLDFWASWCGACIEDIKDSKKSKVWLAENKIEYIYLSLDKLQDKEKWLRSSKQNQIEKNQYLVIDGFKSPLAEFLSLKFLPTYALLNQQHEIKSTNAPRPTVSQFDQLRQSVNGLKRNVVKFDR